MEPEHTGLDGASVCCFRGNRQVDSQPFMFAQAQSIPIQPRKPTLPTALAAAGKRWPRKCCSPGAFSMLLFSCLVVSNSL